MARFFLLEGTLLPERRLGKGGANFCFFQPEIFPPATNVLFAEKRDLPPWIPEQTPVSRRVEVRRAHFLRGA